MGFWGGSSTRSAVRCGCLTAPQLIVLPLERLWEKAVKVKLEVTECFKILLCSTLCCAFARQGLWNLLPPVPPHRVRLSLLWAEMWIQCSSFLPCSDVLLLTCIQELTCVLIHVCPRIWNSKSKTWIPCYLQDNPEAKEILTLEECGVRRRILWFVGNLCELAQACAMFGWFFLFH